MIKIEKGIFTEKEVADVIKYTLGMRYRINKDGDFEIYTNTWTIGADIFRNIKRKMNIG